MNTKTTLLPSSFKSEGYLDSKGPDLTAGQSVSFPDYIYVRLGDEEGYIKFRSLMELMTNITKEMEHPKN